MSNLRQEIAEAHNPQALRGLMLKLYDEMNERLAALETQDKREVHKR